jgi:hypothetical protein
MTHQLDKDINYLKQLCKTRKSAFGGMEEEFFSSRFNKPIAIPVVMPIDDEIKKIRLDFKKEVLGFLKDNKVNPEELLKKLVNNETQQGHIIGPYKFKSFGAGYSFNLKASYENEENYITIFELSDH